MTDDPILAALVEALYARDRPWGPEEVLQSLRSQGYDITPIQEARSDPHWVHCRLCQATFETDDRENAVFCEECGPLAQEVLNDQEAIMNEAIASAGLAEDSE